MSLLEIGRIYAEEVEKQLARRQSALQPVSLCIHPDCSVCKALDKEIEADRKRFEKEQAKKKAEYGKRCKAWVGLIHKLVKNDSHNKY